MPLSQNRLFIKLQKYHNLPYYWCCPESNSKRHNNNNRVPCSKSYVTIFYEKHSLANGSMLRWSMRPLIIGSTLCTKKWGLQNTQPGCSWTIPKIIVFQMYRPFWVINIVFHYRDYNIDTIFYLNIQLSAITSYIIIIYNSFTVYTHIIKKFMNSSWSNSKTRWYFHSAI